MSADLKCNTRLGKEFLLRYVYSTALPQVRWYSIASPVGAAIAKWNTTSNELNRVQFKHNVSNLGLLMAACIVMLTIKT